MHALARIASAAVVALLALTGCAANADDTQDANATSPEGYHFLSGDLPDEPERVVALWRTGSLLADLGVVPVGQMDGELVDYELTPEQFAPVADVPTVGTFEGLDVEAVIELEPDLIIGMDHGGLGIDDDYEELAQLFPVAILEIAEPTDVWANYATVAELVGRDADFSSELDALDASLAEIATEHGDVLGGLEATAWGAMEGTIWVETSKSLTYQRLVAAGFGYNAVYTDDPERYAEELTLENLPELAEQDIIFYDADLDGSISPDVQAVLDEPAFQELPAVQAGNAFPLRGSVVYTFEGAQAMVDDLRAAAEGYSAP